MAYWQVSVELVVHVWECHLWHLNLLQLSLWHSRGIVYLHYVTPNHSLGTPGEHIWLEVLVWLNWVFILLIFQFLHFRYDSKKLVFFVK